MNKKIYIISIIILIIDQVSKCIIDTFIKLNDNIYVIKNFFYITNIHNDGAAWGIFSNKVILLILCTFIALIIIYRYMCTFKNNKRNIIAFGLLTGGIIGNLLDRLFLGFVRDFIGIYIFNYSFPIFNISDSCTVLGVILLIVSIIKGEDKIEKDSNKRKTKKN